MDVSWVEIDGKAIYKLRYKIASYIWEMWVMHLKCHAHREQQEMKLEKLCQELWKAWHFDLFQANKLACQSFMDACRIYKTAESSAMTFFFFFFFFLVLEMWRVHRLSVVFDFLRSHGL